MSREATSVGRSVLRSGLAAFLVLLPTASSAAAEFAPATMRAMRDEAARTIKSLRLPGSPPPYYVAYNVVDTQIIYAVARFGGLVASDAQHARNLRVDLRVGDFRADNTGFVGDRFILQQATTPELLPLDDDYDAVRRELWLVTDRAYKAAVDAFEKEQGSEKTHVTDPDRPDDFSREPPYRAARKAPQGLPPRTEIESLAAEISAVFREFPGLYTDYTTVAAVVQHRMLVSSDGHHVIEPRTWVQVSAAAFAHSAGNVVKSFILHVVPSLEDLPARRALEEEARRMAGEVLAIRDAEVIEDYGGPVLFEGRAASQLMHALLGGALCGTRPPRVRGAPAGFDTPWAKKAGRPVLPPGFAVVDDPRRSRFEERALVGTYSVDDEGTPARAVRLVENGVLEGFLMSRRPRPGFPRSTGHGRMALQTALKARPGNLILSASGALGERELRQRFYEEIEDAGVDYGLIIRLFDEPWITAGQPGVTRTNVAVGLPHPLVVVKVTPDGRESYVRGVEVEPILLRALRRDIIAAGTKSSVFSTFDFDTSRNLAPSVLPNFAVPISVVSPALLFAEIDVKKSEAKSRLPPVVAHPVFEVENVAGDATPP